MTTAAPTEAAQPLRVDPELDVRLDFPLPRDLPAGRRTALFVFGSCFHRELDVESVEVIAGGRSRRRDGCTACRGSTSTARCTRCGGERRRQRPEHDPASADDPECGAIAAASGRPFRFPPPVGPARLSCGSRPSSPTARGPAPRSGGDRGPRRRRRPRRRSRLVAICMATFDPDPELFRAQVESIRAQTDRDWICLISDDCSRAGALRRDRARSSADDARFVVSTLAAAARLLPQLRACARAGAARGRAGRARRPGRPLAPGQAGGAPAPGSATRSSSTATSASSTATGGVLAETYWTERRNNHTNLASLLIGEHDHRRRLAVPARAARRRPAVPRAAGHAVPRPVARARRAGDRRGRLRRPAALRLRPARRPRRSATSGANVGFTPGARGGGGGRAAGGTRSRPGAATYFDGYLRLQVLADGSCSPAAASRIGAGERRAAALVRARSTAPRSASHGCCCGRAFAGCSVATRRSVPRT